MAIEIDKQAPERGWRGIASAPVATGCCCCCCCCLHSLGGTIGALTTRSKPLDATELPLAAIDGRDLEPKVSATGLYWKLIVILCVVAGVVGAAVARDPGAAMTAAAWIAVGLLPAVQLVASFIAAMIITFSNRVGREARLQHLRRITLRAFIGGLIGAALVAPLVVAFLR